MTTGSEVTPNLNGRAPAGPLRAIAAGTAERALSLAHRAGEVALEKLPLNEIMGLVDIQALLDRVDLQKVLESIDMQKVLESIDMQKVIDGIDMQKVLDGIDLNSVIGKVDLDAVLLKTDLGQVIAQSTGGIASSGVDLLRRQGVGLDGFVARWGARLRPRLRDAPSGPPLLVGGQRS